MVSLQKMMSRLPGENLKKLFVLLLPFASFGIKNFVVKISQKLVQLVA